MDSVEIEVGEIVGGEFPACHNLSEIRGEIIPVATPERDLPEYEYGDDRRFVLHLRPY